MGKIATAVLLVLGAAEIAAGVIGLVAPGAYYEGVANFGSLNEHFVRDVGSLNLACGAAMLLAVRRPAWRVPTLAIAAGLFLPAAIIRLPELARGSLSSVAVADVGVLLAVSGLSLALLAVARGDRGAIP